MRVISNISVISTLRECKEFSRADPYSIHPRKIRVIEKIKEIAEKRGWDIVKLEQLVIEDIFKSSGTERKVDGEVIAVKPGALSDDFLIDFSKCARETIEEYLKAGRRQLRDGDIILLGDAHAEGYIGSKTSIIRLFEDQKAMLLGHLIKVRPNLNLINPYYLLAYLNCKLAKYYLNYSVRGQTVGLHARDVKNLPVLVPPRDIQDSIGDKLKQAIEAKIEAEKKRKKIEEIFEKYITLKLTISKDLSTIYNLQTAKKNKRIDPKHFSRKLLIYEKKLIESGLRLERLKDLCKSQIRRGIQPVYDESGEIPVIKTGDVYDDPIRWKTTSKVSKEFYLANRKGQVPKNALVITSTGEGSWGRTSINTRDLSFADGHISIVEIDETKIDPYYVCAFLWTPYGKAQYERRVRGCTGQTEIYPKDLETILIPRLDTNNELEIAKKMRELFESFYRSENLRSQAMNELNKLLELNSRGDNS